MRPGALGIGLRLGARSFANARSIVAFGLLIVTTGSALALTQEAAIENCRMTVGKPFVMACMQANGGHSARETCRAQAHPKVHACVMAALNAANGRANVAVAL